MEKNIITERLTKSLCDCLIDPLTLGGTYKAKITSPNTVKYEIMGREYQASFIDKYSCNIIATNPKTKELMSVPYKKSSEKPDWQNFIKEAYTLKTKISKQ